MISISRARPARENQLVQEDPGRQPRRNRAARHAHVPRDGHRHRRRLLHRGPQHAPRPVRRRGVPHRRGTAARELPQLHEDSRGREDRPASTPSTPATASSASGRSSPRPARRPASPSSARKPEAVHSARRQGQRAPHDDGRRRAGRARHRRPRRGRRGGALGARASASR